MGTQTKTKPTKQMRCLNEDFSLSKYLVCNRCYSLYFQNNWHGISPKNLKVLQDANLVIFSRCENCQERLEKDLWGLKNFKNKP